MRKVLPSILVMLAMAIPGVAFASSHAKATHSQRFDPAHIATVSGQVQMVHPSSKKPAHNAMMWLKLKTGNETVPVHLGPAWYVSKLDLAKGDSLQVTGSRITKGKRSEIIATKVVKGTNELDLRNDKGTPLWRKAKPTSTHAKGHHATHHAKRKSHHVAKKK